jgi:hypothetical protein
MVALDDPANQGQAQAFARAAFRVEALEDMEDFLLCVRRNT